MDHTLVVLEEGAEATLVRETAGARRADAPALARRRRRDLRRPGRPAPVRQHPELGRRAPGTSAASGPSSGPTPRCSGPSAASGSRLAKVNQEVALAGAGARAQVNGVMFTTGRQHLAYFTRQDHQAPHTTSDLLYKGGLKDRSRIVWKGMIRVEKDAQRTDAYQKNDNLVLSELGPRRLDPRPGDRGQRRPLHPRRDRRPGRRGHDLLRPVARRLAARRRPADRRGLLRQRLRPDHARTRPGDAPPGRRRQAANSGAATPDRARDRRRTCLC